VPTYQFICDDSLGGCGYIFEEEHSMSEIDDVKSVCSECNKVEFIHQVWNGISSFGPNKTLGSMADKNNRDFSAEYKEHLDKKHQKKPDYSGSLPDGAKKLKRNEKGDLI
jgi:hypothetical protein